MEFITDNIIWIVIAYIVFSEIRKKNAKQAIEPSNKSWGSSSPIPNTPSVRKTFIDLWPDIWVVPLVIGIAFALLYGLTILFPNAHFYGVEAIQGVIIGLASAFIVTTIAFVSLKLNFPRAWNWYKSTDIEESFGKLTPWQKYQVLLFVLAIFSFVAVMSMLAQK